jgi:hypothetical protein
MLGREMDRSPLPDPTTPHEPGPVIWAALGSLALACGLTWPGILHLSSRLLGHPGNDGWNHVWGYQWVADEIALGRWPGHTDLLVFPTGGTLYFIDTVQALILAPITWTFGAVVALNLSMIGGLALAAFGAWVLARKLTGDGWAAWVAAVIYGASPHLLGQAHNGITETVCAGWLPLSLWALLRLMERPDRRRGLALGLLTAMCILTSWYFGLFALLGMALLVAWRLLLRRNLADGLLPPLVLGAATCVALVMPFMLAFGRSLRAEDALVTRDPDFVWMSLINHNITDALAMVRPGRLPSPDLLALHGEHLRIVVYVGWVALGLAATGWIATRRRRVLAPWLCLGLVFWILTLGPYLNIGGDYVELAGRRIPLPFLWLLEALPGFGRISHPFRFVVGVGLVTALMAAHAVRHLLRRGTVEARALGATVLSALVLTEVVLASPAIVPIVAADARIPAVYSELAGQPGAILDLPMAVPNLERAVYTWYQTVHGRPVPWGLNDPMPQLLLGNRLTATLLRVEATRAQGLPPVLPNLDLLVASRTLARQGVRHVVVHERLYPEAKLAQVEALLRGVAGPPRRVPEDGLQIYTLGVGMDGEGT